MVAVVTSFIPADSVLDRYFRSWLPTMHRWYQGKLIVLHLLATAFVAGAASSLGWEPGEPGADGDVFRSAANGIAWALAAVALLRAEFPGSKEGAAAPGFSLLRTISAKLVSDLEADVSAAVLCQRILSSFVTRLSDARLRRTHLAPMAPLVQMPPY